MALEKRQSISEMLSYLADEANYVSELFHHWAQRKPYVLDEEDRIGQEYLEAQRAFRQRLAYLKRKKFITSKKTEKGLLCEITDEGRVELMKRTVADRPKLAGGQVCLVIYDIPTVANLGRDALRYFLKHIGFIQVQKSVWQTDKAAVEDVLAFVRSAKIQKWVGVYLAKKQL